MKTKKDQTQQNQNPNDPEYLTDREAAAITKVSRSHLHALMACGKIRCHKIGKCLRLVKSEYLEDLAQFRVDRRTGNQPGKEAQD